jgi:hypothetical protein
LSPSATAEITVTAERGANLRPKPLSRLNNESISFDIEERIPRLQRNGQSWPFRLVCVAFLSGARPGLRSLRPELIGGAVQLPANDTYANRG